MSLPCEVQILARIKTMELTWMYNKELFQKLCKDMGLEMEENPKYDEYISRIRENFESMKHE